MISLDVSNSDIVKAKNQISEFEKIDAGSWRYTNVEAWRGVVCEFKTSEWLDQEFNLEIKAKGLDTSGIVDELDVVVNNKKIEIKSATKNYFKYIMPKTHDVLSYPKDYLIASKYDETTSPNKVKIIGFLNYSVLKDFPIKKNKGAPYFEIPIEAFIPIEKFKSEIYLT